MATFGENSFKEDLMKQVKKNVPYRHISYNQLDNINSTIYFLESCMLTELENKLSNIVCDKFFDAKNTGEFLEIGDFFVCRSRVTLHLESTVNHRLVLEVAKCKIMKEFVSRLKGRKCEIDTTYSREDLVEDPIPPLYFGSEIYDCYSFEVRFHL